MIKVVFIGTPEFSVPILEKLIENKKDYSVVGVVSQPDKKVGRKQILTPSPVSKVALDNNIFLLRPVKIKEEYTKIKELNPDIIITCAYGQIIPKDLLDYPKYGCINVHPSLLPKLRGGAPVHRALINGFTKTGVTIMYMDVEMDAGDIISQRSLDILDSDNLDSLNIKLSNLGTELLMETLPLIIDKTSKRIKQNPKEVTYGYNIKKEEEHIDFQKTSREVFNQVRGLSSTPGAYATLDDKVIKIYSGYIGKDIKGTPGQISNLYKDGIGVFTSSGEYVITELQEAGKKRIPAKMYLNGKNKEELLQKRFK